LNEAEPILQQIQAPRLRLLLSKRIADLTGVSYEEMTGMIKLPSIKQKQQAMPKMTRTAASIGRRFLLTVLMRPDLVEANDLNWAVAGDEESRLLRLAMETALAYPSSKPAALMQHFQDKFSPTLLRDIQRELHLLDDSLNVELEFIGARTQLMESHQQKSRMQLLDKIKEKRLSELTEEEKAVLKGMGNTPKNSG
jgi:DNA primase